MSCIIASIDHLILVYPQEPHLSSSNSILTQHLPRKLFLARPLGRIKFICCNFDQGHKSLPGTSSPNNPGSSDERHIGMQ